MSAHYSPGHPLLIAGSYRRFGHGRIGELVVGPNETCKLIVQVEESTPNVLCGAKVRSF
jgi:hypothetical protein